MYKPEINHKVEDSSIFNDPISDDYWQTHAKQKYTYILL